MQRRGGKRIRMDDPPPEYENPMTPMDASEMHENSYANFQPYTPQPPTPMSHTSHNSDTVYGGNDSSQFDATFHSAASSYTQMQPTTFGYDAAHHFEAAAADVSPPPLTKVNRGRGRPRGSYAGRGVGTGRALTAPAATPGGGGRKPGRRSAAEAAADDENSLYSVIKNGRSPLQVIN